MGEELQAKLQYQDELAEAHHDEDPTLGSNPLAFRIRDICVVLPSAGCRDQAKHQDSEHADWVLRRHGEYVLDEEGVELHHLPDEHELYHRDEPHVARVGVQPSIMGE